MSLSSLSAKQTKSLERFFRKVANNTNFSVLTPLNIEDMVMSVKKVNNQRYSDNFLLFAIRWYAKLNNFETAIVYRHLKQKRRKIVDKSLFFDEIVNVISYIFTVVRESRKLPLVQYEAIMAMLFHFGCSYKIKNYDRLHISDVNENIFDKINDTSVRKKLSETILLVSELRNNSYSLMLNEEYRTNKLINFDYTKLINASKNVLTESIKTIFLTANNHYIETSLGIGALSKTKTDPVNLLNLALESNVKNLEFVKNTN